jgi:hypothetical protein
MSFASLKFSTLQVINTFVGVTTVEVFVACRALPLNANVIVIVPEDVAEEVNPTVPTFVVVVPALFTTE